MKAQNGRNDFWLWEFTRRNREYQKDYDALMTLFSEMRRLEDFPLGPATSSGQAISHEENLDAYISFLEGCIETGLTSRISKDELLRLKSMYMIFLYKYDLYPHDYHDGLSADAMAELAFKGKADEKLQVKIDFIARERVTKILHTDGSNLTIRLDVSRSLDVILNEVKLYCLDLKASLKGDPNFGRDDLVINQLRTIRKKKIQGKYKKAAKKKRDTGSIWPRILGLWVWEYVQDNKCTIVSARDALLDRYQVDLDLLPKSSYVDPDRIYDLYTVVNKSIESREVIAIA